MALTSISLLKIKSIKTPFSSSVRPTNPPSIVSQLHTTTQTNQNDGKKWKILVVSTALAAAVITFSSDVSALADLNKCETENRTEFGVSSVSDYGSENLRKTKFTTAAEYKASLLSEGKDNHQETTDPSSFTYNNSQNDGGSDQEKLKAMAAMAQFVRWAMEDSLQEFVDFVSEYLVRKGHYSISRLYH